MASKKVTELTTLSIPSGVDYIYVIDDPLGTPTGKKMSLDALFGGVPSNTAINGTFTARSNATFSGSQVSVSSNVSITGTTQVGVLKTTSNGVLITNSLTPANSSIGIPQGKVFWDANYFYVAVSNTVVKRIPLQSF